MSNPWISTNSLRRHPVSGPILVGCFRGLFAALSAGALGSLFFGLSTTSPIGPNAGGAEALVWLLLPYLVMFVCAFWWTGWGVWRGVSFFLGSLVLAGSGLFQVGRAWFFLSPDAARASLPNLALTQWIIIACTLVLALVPGLLIRRGIDHVQASGPAASPPPLPQKPTDTHKPPP